VHREIKENLIAANMSRLLKWGRSLRRDMTLMFTETMPLGDVGADRIGQYLPLDRLRVIESR
jgi:cyclic pyranopterin phosphate synthase